MTNEEVSDACSSVVGTETPLVSTSATIIGIDVSDSFQTPYAKAYYDVIVNLIETNGFSYDDEKWGTMGFYSGDLIDFENDGNPELVCIYRKEFFHNLCIYRYENNKATQLLDVVTGDYLFGDNWAGIEFAVIDGTSYVLIQKCDWGDVERIYIYSIENGTLSTQKLYADAQVDEEDSGPFVEHYLNCSINDNSVSEEEYIAVKEYYYQDTTYWDNVYEQDDALKFIKSLSVESGINEKDVHTLIEDNS